MMMVFGKHDPLNDVGFRVQFCRAGTLERVRPTRCLVFGSRTIHGSLNPDLLTARYWKHSQPRLMRTFANVTARTVLSVPSDVFLKAMSQTPRLTLS